MKLTGDKMSLELDPKETSNIIMALFLIGLFIVTLLFIGIVYIIKNPELVNNSEFRSLVNGILQP